VETLLKGTGAIIVVAIIILLLGILKKINDGVKSHVF
jgi:hypothetical protein